MVPGLWCQPLSSRAWPVSQAGRGQWMVAGSRCPHRPLLSNLAGSLPLSCRAAKCNERVHKVSVKLLSLPSPSVN